MSKETKYYPYKLVKLNKFSGSFCSVYTPYLIEQKTTLFQRFGEENEGPYLGEYLDILKRVRSMGVSVGADIDFFKVHEGRFGDKVCCLYDLPNIYLRLFCIRYSDKLIVLGGGGIKNVNAWQDDPKLNEEGNLMIKIAEDVDNRIKSGGLAISEDGFHFDGNLKFENETRI